MERYIYLEKTFNLPGWDPNDFIFKVAKGLLRIARREGDNSGTIMSTIDQTINDYKRIYERINTSKVLPDNPKMIMKGKEPSLNELGEIEYKGESITYQNWSQKKLINVFFSKILPTFLVFFKELNDRDYIKDTYKPIMVKAFGILNQLYKINPLTQESQFDQDTEKLENLLKNYENVINTIFNEDVILQSGDSADSAISLVKDLFDRKSSGQMHVDKKTYNEAFRMYLKLAEYSENIAAAQGKLSSLNLSSSEYDIEAAKNNDDFIREMRQKISQSETDKERAELTKQLTDELKTPNVPSEQKVVRKIHPSPNRSQNFELPSFMSHITTIGGRTGYQTNTRQIKQNTINIGITAGVDASDVNENREFFGNTRVFNDIMKIIIMQKRKKILSNYNDKFDRRSADLNSHFVRQSPMMKEYRDKYAEGSKKRDFWFNFQGKNFWYNPTQPHDVSFHYFKRQEAILIDAILEARHISVGAEGAYDLDLIYNDFIYLLRVLLNGNLKNAEGKEITFKQSLDNNGAVIRKLVNEYVKDNDIGIKETTKALSAHTTLIGAKKRSDEIVRKKISGEMALTKQEIKQEDSRIKKLKKELDSLFSREAEIVTDLLTIEKMEQDPQFYKKEKSEIIDFYTNNTRVIKIKKTKNLISPTIMEKPSNSSELKKVLSRVLKKEINEITERDIQIAEEIFSLDNNNYFTRKFFLIEFLNAIKNDLTKLETALPTSVTMTNQIKKPDTSSDSQIKNFLKKVFPPKIDWTAKQIEIARKALLQDESETMSKDFFKGLYDYMDKNDTLEMELDTIESFKKISEKEVEISDLLSPLSTNMYSDNISLEITNLSEKIKFSHSQSDLVMQLKPKDKNDSKSGGEFTIAVAKRSLNEFLSKNPYILDKKNKNPLVDMDVYIENIEVDSYIKIIRGTYEVEFKESKSPLSIQDISDIYDQEKITKTHIMAGKPSSKMKQELQDLYGSQREIRKELLLSARQKHRVFQNRLSSLSGQKISGTIEDDFLRKSRILLDNLNTQRDYLTFDVSQVKSVMNDYEKLINFEGGVVGSEKVRRQAADVRREFARIFNSINSQKTSTLGNLIDEIDKEAKYWKLDFFKVNYKKEGGVSFIFNKDAYDGNNERQYTNVVNSFNSQIEVFMNFKFTPKASYIDFFKEVAVHNDLFVELVRYLKDIYNLVSTQENEETYARTKMTGLSIEKSLGDVEKRIEGSRVDADKLYQQYRTERDALKMTTKKKLPKVQEESTGKYTKYIYRDYKPTKFNILNEVINRNEIK
jgi:hypothetical protein